MLKTNQSLLTQVKKKKKKFDKFLCNITWKVDMKRGFVFFFFLSRK